MRRKAGLSNAAPDLRLIVTKPEPEPISKETEVLSAILERSVSYERYLSRDSVGGERMTETIRFKVTLCGADNPLSSHIARKKLHSFLTERLGTTLSEAGTRNERLIEALYEAEDANLVRLKHLK